MTTGIAWWPAWLIMAVAHALAGPLPWLPLGRIQAAHCNIQVAYPELGFLKRQWLLYRCLVHWLATALEILQAGAPSWHGRCLKKRMSLEGLDHLDRARKEGRGVILLGAHAGNFPWFVLRLAVEGYPVSVLYKEQRTLPAHFFRGILERFGIEGLAVQEGRHQATRRALRALRNGRVLFIHMDQGRRHGEMVRFMGKMVRLPAGPAVLAAASRSPCLPACTWRTRLGHTARIHPPLELIQKPSRTGLQANLQTMAQVLEQMIREHPTQWLWMHRLFKWGVDHSYCENTSLREIP